jgi:hypothetical protein
MCAAVVPLTRAATIASEECRSKETKTRMQLWRLNQQTASQLSCDSVPLFFRRWSILSQVEEGGRSKRSVTLMSSVLTNQSEALIETSLTVA